MPAQTSRSHLLAIDDDAALRALYKDLFAEVGFQVTVTSPSVTAMDVRSIEPDLVLLEWPYPWSEPPALLQAMRQTADLATMPTIIATMAPERAAINLPNDTYTRLVAKPFTVAEILDCADLLLARARDLSRRTHALRRRLGSAQERQSHTLYRWPTPQNQVPDQS